MTAEHSGADALMAAITGEELSDEARADTAFMAEHRKAEADVALLREQLGIIGETLARDTGTQEEATPVRAPRPTRPRVRRFALAGLAVTAAAGVLSGMGWLLAQAGGGVDSLSSGGSSDDSGAKTAESAGAGSAFDSPGYLACARLVAEGRIAQVERVPGTADQERITLDVTRSYKPEKGKKELTFVVDEEAVRKDLHKGDHILVSIPQHAATADYVLVGEKSIARERAGLDQALQKSADVAC
ncbi:hypothetical protein [Streptomyces sp. NPDC047043]|uniref:hypothetical protein n=1 Tax=Streptomyces sp. NPDC047043 TaxID=3154497 RepID=UPI0033DD3877